MVILSLLIQWFILLMLLWIVLSYVVSYGRLTFDHPVRRIYLGLSTIINPVLDPIRSVVPPVRIGGAALDLSPLILIIGLNLIGGFLL